MARRIMEVHMATGFDGTQVTHIERVKWAEEMFLDMLNDETREEVVERIRLGQQFFAQSPYGARAAIERYQHSNGTWFIRTVRDGTPTDNLLFLKRY